MENSQNKIDLFISKYFFAIVLFFLILRLGVIFTISPLDDEIYHWQWAKDLNWSYYDHPGMVAWIIKPFIMFFGDHLWAVRMPGLISYGLTIFILFTLTSEMFSRETARIFALLMLVIPLWSFGSLGTVPDTPLAVFWSAIVYTFWQSIRPTGPNRSVRSTWLIIGLLMGLGMLSKYSCCLIGLGIGLFLIFSKKHRHQLATPWPYLGALLTFIIMTPVLIWNMENNWASFLFQFVDRHQGASYTWTRWYQFFMSQWLAMSPPVYFLILLTLVYSWKNKGNENWNFLASLALPAFLIFGIQPFFSEFKPHWTAPAYMLLIIGAAQIFRQGFMPWIQPFSSKWLKTSIGFFVFFFLLYIPIYFPIITDFGKSILKDKWQPHYDFTNELYGWDEVGPYTDKIKTELEKSIGTHVEIAALRYEMISQVSWSTRNYRKLDQRVWHVGEQINHFWFLQNGIRESYLKDKTIIVVQNDKYLRPLSEVIFLNSFNCNRQTLEIFRGENLARYFYFDICTPKNEESI